MTRYPNPSREAASRAEAAAVRMAALPQLRHWIAVPVLAAVLIIAGGLALRFIPALTTADMSVDAELSHDHTPPLTAVAMVINVMFSPAGGVLMIAALCLYLLLVRRSPVNAVATGLVAAGGWVSSELFKVLVARHRPDSTALYNPLIPEPGTDSFPSGHVALASALAIAIFLLARGTRWQRPAAVLGITVAMAVAFSRVYLGVHYPTDVTASFLTAATGAAFLTGLWNRFGLLLLARMPFLAKLGPVPAPRG
ncbi:membrane-associated phospholipid phosphatase [Arthrobacter sp. B2I5]|uniref:phosphatase PAP2 family protein n=1 Tax=Arthrobacter sp. B2I5 TaxID=3042266 RepID=UPI002784AE3C|nr:phosphatase PAP2 family protein [Arthrobacter sp. B2I5]MDQ0828116.1 membrane-associated phospholipid phosphatase [Arthrobacter sp. B2I5]